jgi:flagellar basal-body rod modification protein FlgD
MNIAATDSVASLGTQPTKKKSELDMEGFIRLLTVQLANQNPLEPMNDRDFFAQMAQLGQVQGMEKLQASSDLQQAQNLMGKHVTATRPLTETGTGTAQMVEGVVKRVSIRNGEYYLGVQEANGGMIEVGMKNLQSVAPQDDVSSASHLIGKGVSGKGWLASDGSRTEVAVQGKVQGVEMEGGVLVLRVQTDAGIATLPLSNLQQVAE